MMAGARVPQQAAIGAGAFLQPHTTCQDHYYSIPACGLLGIIYHSRSLSLSLHSP